MKQLKYGSRRNVSSNFYIRSFHLCLPFLLLQSCQKISLSSIDKGFSPYPDWTGWYGITTAHYRLDPQEFHLDIDNNDSIKGKQCSEGRQWIISTSRWAIPNAQASPNKVCFHLSFIFIFETINYYILDEWFKGQAWFILAKWSDGRSFGIMAQKTVNSTIFWIFLKLI